MDRKWPGRYTQSDAYRYGHFHANADGYSYGHVHTHTYCYGYSYCDPDRNAISYLYAHAHPHSDGDTSGRELCYWRPRRGRWHEGDLLGRAVVEGKRSHRRVGARKFQRLRQRIDPEPAIVRRHLAERPRQ